MALSECRRRYRYKIYSHVCRELEKSVTGKCTSVSVKILESHDQEV